MNFYWNAFSLKNIIIDIAICLGYIIVFGLYFRQNNLKFYAERIEPYSLDVERIIIKSDRIKTPIRITHLSDLQTDGINDMHINARKISDEFEPHLIIFTGDVLNHLSILEEVENYLKQCRYCQNLYL